MWMRMQCNTNEKKNAKTKWFGQSFFFYANLRAKKVSSGLWGGCHWSRGGSTWQPKYVKTIDVSLPWLDGIQKLNRELWVALKPSATKMWKRRRWWRWWWRHRWQWLWRYDTKKKSEWNVNIDSLQINYVLCDINPIKFTYTHTNTNRPIRFIRKLCSDRFSSKMRCSGAWMWMIAYFAYVFRIHWVIRCHGCCSRCANSMQNVNCLLRICRVRCCAMLVMYGIGVEFKLIKEKVS